MNDKDIFITTAIMSRLRSVDPKNDFDSLFDHVAIECEQDINRYQLQEILDELISGNVIVHDGGDYRLTE